MHDLTCSESTNKMICLHDPDNPCICSIFGVSRDNAGFPCFLIHEEGADPKHRGQWRFLSAKYFVPTTRDNVSRYIFHEEVT